MNISVWGAEQPFHRGIDHIVKLFDEQPTLKFDETSGDEDAMIRLSIEGDRRASFTAVLADAATGQVHERSVTRDLGVARGEEGWMRSAKHALHYVLVQVLEQYTGMEQPWGVLTGIRPTKLLHQGLLRQRPAAEVHDELRNDYLVTREKIDLMQTIVDRQLAVIPDLHRLKDAVSVYIGIPFCPTKCAYCTFPAYAIDGKQGSVDGFLAGLHYELRAIGEWLKANGIEVTTVYFGGGTPTSITADEMDRLYAALYESFPNPAAIREVTVEAGRPDTITPEKLTVLKRWGIDRISINPQSYTQETLNAIGRHHTVEETVEKYRLAREMGMTNINMDLIIGLPGEGIEHFRHTLDVTAELMPESLTVHTLSFKRASEMTQNKEKYRVAGRDEIRHMMAAASDWTSSRGYAPYYLYRQKNILGNMENVGYALPGQESLYNIIIMEEVQTIIGIGCGASSKWVHRDGTIDRFANPKEPKAYNESFEKYTRHKIEILERMFGSGADVRA